MFLDFLAEPENSLRRKREGTYVSYMYGHEDRTVKVFIFQSHFDCCSLTVVVVVVVVVVVHLVVTVVGHCR